jgi:hypothetical protein
VERTLSWDDGEVAVRSVSELDALLDRLTAEAESGVPFMVTVARPDGATLSIGLGRAESVASYVSGSLDPPYFGSRGDGEREEHIEFVFGGELTEFPPGSAVPTEAAREALRVFFETGELSPKIGWEET